MIEILAERREAEADTLGPSGLLASIKALRDIENAEADRQLDLAARWADLHAPESIHSAAAFTVPGSEHEEPIAGEGCPLVAEFCIAELGTVLGISTTAAKKLVGHALELRTSPHGRRYRRDRHGTTALDPPAPSPPRIPSQRRP